MAAANVRVQSASSGLQAVRAAEECAECGAALGLGIGGRALVILPLSMVRSTDASSCAQKSDSAALPSSLARCARPRVHAKMDATAGQENQRNKLRRGCLQLNTSEPAATRLP